MHYDITDPWIPGLATCWLGGNCMNVLGYMTKSEHAIVKYSALQESSEAENADLKIQELAFILQ